MLFGFVAVPGRLKRAFEALEIYNYFKAKELFYKSLKRDSVPAAYGLAVIYGRDDNPFFQPDSAHKFARIARRGFPDVPPDDRADYAELGVDSISVHRVALNADSLIYLRAIDANSPEAYDRFMDRALTNTYRHRAETSRDSLAFALAERINSSQGFWDFVRNYPHSPQVEEAYKRYQQRLYRERTAAETVDAYRQFIVDYPDSPYRSEAEYRVYQLATAPETPEAYDRFIIQNPDNEYVEEAWRKLYLLEVESVSPESIAAFALKYRDYPFQDELQRDFNNATTRFYPYEQDGKWGYIDETGQVRIEPIYDWNEPFKEGLAIVGRGDFAGYVDKTGAAVTPIAFDEAFPFRNGYAVVEKEGLYGAINRAGEWVLQPIYEDLGEYSDGFFFASQDDLYGYVDDKGHVAIDFVYDDATDFEDDRAVVEREGKKALIDRSGKPLTAFEYDWIERFPTDHVPARVRADGRFGLIDRTGAPVSDTLYAAIGDFGDGLALASNGKTYGFIDAYGDTAIAFTYTYRDEALSRSHFVDGFAPVYQKDKVGIIDTSGAKVFPAIFEDVGAYRGRLIPVKKRGQWGYADLEVNLAIPYRYSAAGTFHDSLAIVAVDDRFGVIDTLGRMRVDFAFSELSFIDTLLLARDTAYGLIDTRGNTVVPLEYRDAEIVDERVIRWTDHNGNHVYYDRLHGAFLRPDEEESGR